MSENISLVRVRAFTPTELTDGLAPIVDPNRGLLRRRYSPGTVKRLGGTAAEISDRVTAMFLQDRDGSLQDNGHETYAVVHNETRIVGLATLLKTVKAYSHSYPLPPAISRRVPAQWIDRRDADLGAVNVTGWTAEAFAGHTQNLYAQLLAQVPHYSAWTVEPTRSGDLYHEAIMQAGMLKYGDPTHYDVNEIASTITPESQAYIRPAGFVGR
jgi:hypothetical protein